MENEGKTGWEKHVEEEEEEEFVEEDDDGVVDGEECCVSMNWRDDD